MASPSFPPLIGSSEMTYPLSKKNNTGFSLIEVMVATLILLIIVLMIGSIFSQGTSAWDTGYARAEGGMIVRGVVGSIQRELSTAVDGRTYPGAWKNEWHDPVEVKPSEVTFICLKESKGAAGSVEREPWLVTYSWGSKEMKRSAKPLKANTSGLWSLGTEVSSTIYSERGQEDQKSTYSADFEFEAVDRLKSKPIKGVRPKESDDFVDNIFWNIPYVTIKVELTRTSSFSGLEVRSWGPDGKEDTGDDIIVQ